MGANWYCIRTATRQEARAVEGLLEIGYGSDHVYLPCETRWNRLGRVRRPKDVPLLPGYLFVWAEPDALWKIELVNGVYAILRHGPNANGERGGVAIPADFVGELRADQAQGRFDLTKARGKGLQIHKGAKIKVSSGSWAGWAGEIVAERGHSRVKVLLSMLGALRVPAKAAEVAIADIEPQDGATTRVA